MPTDRSTLAVLLLVAALPLAGTGCSSGSGGAATDVFLVDMWSDGGLVVLGDPDNLTDRDGYDNQPCFSADGKAVLYVQRDGDRADVFRYDIDLESAERVTDSTDREYSPQPLPGGDGYSAVRVERDGRQRLWTYDASWGNASPVLAGVTRPVLYYAWLTDSTVGLVLERDARERSLYIGDVSGGDAERLLDDVGRSVHAVPGKGLLSVLHKESPADWWIAEVDPASGEVRHVARAIQGSEDYAYTPDGAIVMAGGAKVYMWVPDVSVTWQTVADFTGSDVSGISRIAVSPNGDAMAFVAERE